MSKLQIYYCEYDDGVEYILAAHGDRAAQYFEMPTNRVNWMDYQEAKNHGRWEEYDSIEGIDHLLTTYYESTNMYICYEEGKYYIYKTIDDMVWESVVHYDLDYDYEYDEEEGFDFQPIVLCFLSYE